MNEINKSPFEKSETKGEPMTPELKNQSQSQNAGRGFGPTHDEHQKLRDDLRSVREDFSSLREDVRHLASDAAGTGVHVARRGMDTVRHSADDMAHKAEGVYSEARKTVSSRPLVSLLVAVGIGALAARIFTSRH